MTIASPHLGSPSVWTDARLLYALEEVVEKELNRHLKVAKDWMPHEYVPWSDARNFPGFFEDGDAWDKEQSKVTEIGRIALVVNLLTDLGHEPVLVDIGEFEKLEGCVTCLSVRMRDLYA